VEFKIISREKFRTSPISMFYYDLIVGHRRLLGGEELMAGCDHHRHPENIPACEAIRLLMNRCTGLLFAVEKMRGDYFSTYDADFVGRNLAKAQLGFGDAYLAAAGQYHWSCRERNRRLKSTLPPADAPWLKALCEHHDRGVEFKLHPQMRAGSVTDFQPQLDELKDLGGKLWLWLESRRLQQTFTSIEDYVFSLQNKCPEKEGLRNRLVNLKTFGPGFHEARYPRERLLTALPALLWLPKALSDISLLNRLQYELRSHQTTFAGMIEDFRKLWRRFN
jgi:hypothetical protein